jgi:hypothetical protein
VLLLDGDELQSDCAASAIVAIKARHILIQLTAEELVGPSAPGEMHT